MKLDYDLVREIMLTIENSENMQGPSEPELVAAGEKLDMSRDEVGYTLTRLHEANFITGKPLIADASYYFLISGNLTHNGHQYLDNVRDSKIWKQTKNALSGLKSISLEVVSQTAAALIAKSIGLN